MLDPFFGVGGFAFHALLNGLNVVGVELEANFVELARKNLELWRSKYGPGVAVLDDLRARGKLAPYGAVTVLQGDSRQLRQVVAGVQGAVSSPPYANAISSDGSGIDWTKRKDRIHNPAHKSWQDAEALAGRYGATPSNLGNLPPGDFASVISGAVGSPPFADSLNSDDPDKRGGLFRDEKRRNDRTLTAEYGESAGQLGRMHSVSSPPYAQTEITQRRNFAHADVGGQPANLPTSDRQNGYSVNPSNLGNAADDFWSAASLIMSEVAAVLPAGAYAVWVCKRFVRDGAIVEFSQQWAALGEHHGFETVEWIRAWLVEEQAAQMTLDGGVKRKSKERKSFFRRLAESKGSPRIDWEDVIIQVRKGATP